LALFSFTVVDFFANLENIPVFCVFCETKGELSVRNDCEFIVAAHDLQAAPPKKQRAMAEAIYKAYIAPESSKKIVIPKESGESFSSLVLSPSPEALMGVQKVVMGRLQGSDTFKEFVSTHSDVIISEVLKEQTLKRLFEVRSHMVNMIESLKRDQAMTDLAVQGRLSIGILNEEKIRRRITALKIRAEMHRAERLTSFIKEVQSNKLSLAGEGLGLTPARPPRGTSGKSDHGRRSFYGGGHGTPIPSREPLGSQQSVQQQQLQHQGPGNLYGRSASFFIDMQWDSSLANFDRDISRLTHEITELQKMQFDSGASHTDLRMAKLAELNSLKTSLLGMETSQV